MQKLYVSRTSAQETGHWKMGWVNSAWIDKFHRDYSICLQARLLITVLKLSLVKCNDPNGISSKQVSLPYRKNALLFNSFIARIQFTSCFKLRCCNFDSFWDWVAFSRNFIRHRRRPTNNSHCRKACSAVNKKHVQSKKS